MKETDAKLAYLVKSQEIEDFYSLMASRQRLKSDRVIMS